MTYGKLNILSKIYSSVALACIYQKCTTDTLENEWWCCLTVTLGIGRLQEYATWWTDQPLFTRSAHYISSDLQDRPFAISFAQGVIDPADRRPIIWWTVDFVCINYIYWGVCDMLLKICGICRDQSVIDTFWGNIDDWNIYCAHMYR
jgi:hypothetical protein